MRAFRARVRPVSFATSPAPQRAMVLGDVRFTISPRHDSVTSYDVRVYPQAGGALVDSEDIGKPTPDHYGDINVNLTSFFGTIAAGNYTVAVAAIAPGGTSESVVSDAFSLPLS